MNSLKLKKGDTVMVISGKEKGKKGKILKTDPDSGKVYVEGINIATLHKKPRKTGEQGGIIKQEAGLYASKVMYYCPKCKKPVRVGINVLANGEKVRQCKSCEATI